MSDICIICGGKISRFTKNHKLADGTPICHKCFNSIPEYIRDNAETIWNLDMYLQFSKYIEYAENVYAPQFKETERYRNMHIDARNGLFYIESQSQSSKKIIFDMKYLSAYDFLVEKPHIVSNMIGLGKHVVADLYIKFEMNRPVISVKAPLALGITLRTEHINNNYEYQAPKDMDKFQKIFHTSCQRKIQEENTCKKNEYIKHERERVNNKEPPDALQKAITLFMLDDADKSSITLDMIKKQRNRLLKIYHPDEGDIESNAYVQKINAAYDILYKKFF